ncbi:hypothetical protein ACLUEY_01290 [Vreelandella aquamarina]
MATKKSNQPEEVTPHADETATGEGAAPEPTSAPAETATTADAGAASTTPGPPAPSGDDAGQPLPDQTVLILRDETIAGKDYRPGDTPKLPGADVAALVDRKAGDINPKAIAAARKARAGAATEDAVIE